MKRSIIIQGCIALFSVVAMADTYSLVGDDPAYASSLDGSTYSGQSAKPAGWTNGAETHVTPLAENNYVISNGYQIRTPHLKTSATFPGNLLTVESGVCMYKGATTGGTMTIPHLRVTGPFDVHNGDANSTSTFAGDYEIAEGGVFTVRNGDNLNGTQKRTTKLSASFSGVGEIVARTWARGTGTSATSSISVQFEGSDNAGFTGRFVCYREAANLPFTCQFTQAGAWFGNPSELVSDAVVVTNGALLRFSTSVASTGTNRGFNFGGANDSPGAIQVDGNYAVVIDGPVSGAKGFVKKGKGKLVLAGDLSGLDQSAIVVEDGEIIVHRENPKPAYTALDWMCGEYKANADISKAIGGGGNCPNGSWVDTGYIPDDTDTIEVKFRLNQTGFNQTIFSSRPFDGHTGTISAFFIKDNSNIRFDRKSLDTSKTTPKNSVRVNVDYVIRLEGNTLKGKLISGSTTNTVSLTSGDFDTTESLFVCANKGHDNTVVGVSPWVFYYIKVWDKDGKLKFDGVPARDESKLSGVNDRYGIYDTVGKEFHPNTGNNAYYQVGVKDASLIPNGSFETGVKRMTVSPSDKNTGFVNADDSGISSWRGGIVTCPDNVQVKTSTVPDGDYALVLRNDAATTNEFTVVERGDYELSFKYLARWSNSSLVAVGHDFEAVIDGITAGSGRSDMTDVWLPFVATGVLLERGRHTVVLRGIAPTDGKVHSTAVDDVRLDLVKKRPRGLIIVVE